MAKKKMKNKFGFEQPIYDLALEIVDVINKAMSADKNNDGKIKGAGEITAMIFLAISEVPSIISDVNATVQYYKDHKHLNAQNVIVDVIGAVNHALGELELKDKTWVAPVQRTLSAMMAIMSSVNEWVTYAKIDQSRKDDISLIDRLKHNKK